MTIKLALTFSTKTHTNCWGQIMSNFGRFFVQPTPFAFPHFNPWKENHGGLEEGIWYFPIDWTGNKIIGWTKCFLSFSVWSPDLECLNSPCSQDSLKTLKRLRWKWLWLEERSLWCVMWESGVAKSERRYEGHIGAQNTDEYFLHNFIGYIFLNRISRRMWKSLSKAKKDIIFGQIALITRVSNHWLNICVGISINVFSFKIILEEAQIAECKCFSRPVNTQLVEIGVDD